MLEAKSGLSAEVVNNASISIGGIPRWVVDADLDETEDMLDAQIENLSSKTLDDVFSSRGYLNLPSQVDKTDSGKSTDLIFQIKPTTIMDPLFQKKSKV